MCVTLLWLIIISIVIKSLLGVTYVIVEYCILLNIECDYFDRDLIERKLEETENRLVF